MKPIFRKAWLSGSTLFLDNSSKWNPPKSGEVVEVLNLRRKVTLTSNTVIRYKPVIRKWTYDPFVSLYRLCLTAIRNQFIKRTKVTLTFYGTAHEAERYIIAMAAATRACQENDPIIGEYSLTDQEVIQWRK